MKKIIIFIGAPGSGKGTQAKRIAAKYHYAHISTGDLLRTLLSSRDLEPDEAEALKAMRSGKLVPDWLIYRLAFRESEASLNADHGVVFDGAIRSAEQAQVYQEYFSGKGLAKEVVAIEISLTDEESFNRLAKRRVCENCGEIVSSSVVDQPACPKCGGQLAARSDDKEDVVRKRIVEQGNVTLVPIREYYKNLGILKTVNGSESIAKVESDIEMILAS